MENILVFKGQDPTISHEAGKFTIWLVPALLGFAVLQTLVRYYQMQSLVVPMLISSFTSLVLHVPLCWILVFKSGLQALGAALAISVSVWENVIILWLYMRYSSFCAKTRAPISMELFKAIGEFFRFAVPSSIMICLNTISTLYCIPYGVGAAASTRISNELGAGNPEGAKVSVVVTMCIAVLETTIVRTTLFGCRHVYGYTFSNEKEVIDHVTFMAPLVCVSVILDSIQGVLSEISRGCGWQHIGAYINLGAFYLCGIPVAAMLSFWAKLGGKGLWIGIQLGSFVQTLLLSIISCRIDWEQQASDARKRLFDEQFLVENGLS